MCGIAGHVAPQESLAKQRTVPCMVTALARRGPDSEGFASWAGAALGHRRLAILDLSDAARQPMLSEDNQVGVVFNGCIYNFRTLRQELESHGHRFRTQSDTEVLLHGYRQWAIDGLTDRLHGMFAFAIWDDRCRTLFLVRDRLGVKPLCYWLGDQQIAFASTAGALHSAGLGGDVDPRAILDFLEYGFVSEAHAVWQGIRKLPPATILEWRDGDVRQRSYWSLPDAAEGPPMAFNDAVEETERLLLEAVKLRLVADVPVGVLLSGGIDSALVCWAMRTLGAEVKAFTVGAPGEVSDESAAAAHTARVIGIEHEIVTMPDTDFPLDDLVDAYSEPFACESAQAMLWVSQAVKRQATVLLTGDGGDDVFLGYPFFYNAWMAQRLARRIPTFAVPAAKAARRLVPRIGLGRRLANFLGYATGGLREFSRAHDGLPFYERRSMLGDRLAGLCLPQRDLPASRESARRLLCDVLDHHLGLQFISEFMVKVDGATMHHGIEARAPFLDQKLWEFASRLPVEVHFHQGRLKSVLREIAHRRIGPKVAFRKKQGFTVPVESRLAREWSGMLRRLDRGALLEREGWIAPGSLRAPIHDALTRKLVPVQLWRMLVLEHWMRTNADRSEWRDGTNLESTVSGTKGMD
ncbi:MAG: asparagine synthase (glutamine-hydrolyzing) [Bryobacteraceae bacterium]